MIDKEQRYQFGRFVLVGIVNTGVFALFVWIFVGLNGFSQTLSYIAAFAVANIVSFFLHSAFTFRVNVDPKKYAKFIISSIAALGAVTASGLVGDKYGIDYRLTFIMTLFLVPIATFLTLKFWAFK